MTKSNVQKNSWNEPIHVFFSPKLSLQGKNIFPQLSDYQSGNHGQNFFTILKKPIGTAYDKLPIHKDKRLLVGFSASTPKEMPKRTQTTEGRRRSKSKEIEE